MTVLIACSGVGYSADIGNIGIDSVESTSCATTVGEGAVCSGCDIGAGRIVGTRLATGVKGRDSGKTTCITGLLIIIVGNVERIRLALGERCLIRCLVYEYVRNDFAFEIIRFSCIEYVALPAYATRLISLIRPMLIDLVLPVAMIIPSSWFYDALPSTIFCSYNVMTMELTLHFVCLGICLLLWLFLLNWKLYFPKCPVCPNKFISQISR